MRRNISNFVIAALVGIAAVLAGYMFLPEGNGPAPALAQVGTVTFPDLDALVHYTTVRRGVTREHMLTNQTALDAIQAGKPVPTGTHVVLVDYQSDVLTRYLIAQKTGDGTDDWAYQPFNTDRSLRTVDESPARCYSCHQSRQDRQFMFTFSDARSFRHCSSGKIIKSLAWMRANMGLEVSIAGLAREVGMSVPSYHVHFRALTGTSPMQYLKAMRLHEARLMVARQDKTIAEVAASVGYVSPAQFSRDFKRHFGRTASEESKWIRQHLGELAA